jgi:hypothetical protein
MFSDLQRAENTTLRRAGHRAADQLSRDDLAPFKRNLLLISRICAGMS